ncbi:MAG: family 10 glycosylhydrolase [Verrucomicrobiales bacterium]
MALKNVHSVVAAWRHIACLVVLLFCGLAQAQSSEFRGLWVDAWGAGFLTPAQSTQLVADCRTYNFNAIVVQMRRRGDAFYFPQAPNGEPRTTAMAANYDALADLIAKAHASVPRIEVHCWVVANLIWSGSTPPPQPGHVFNAHPEYLMKNSAGQSQIAEGYYLDPGNPDAMAWNRRMALDIASRYDIDGFHWDYIRYPQQDAGFNDVAIARFNEEFGLTGKPSASSPQFSAWRRRQVTDFLRWVNADLLEVKPQLVISTAVFGSRSDAYNARFQDWAAWTREGILDIAMPMNYSGNNSGVFNPRVDDAYLNQGVRKIYMGQGAYLNTPQNTVTQLKYARSKGLQGTVFYSYRTPNSGAVDKAGTLSYVKQNFQPTWVPTPTLPWKSSPTRGIAKGRVTLPNGAEVYNASVSLNSNPAQRQQTEAHGAFAFFETVPGTYIVTASASQLGSASGTITVQAGKVSSVNLVLSGTDVAPPVISNIEVSGISDIGATIAWTTDEESKGILLHGTTSNMGTTNASSSFSTFRSISLAGLLPNTTYYYRVQSEDKSGNKSQSAIAMFKTNPAGVITPIIIDNDEAVFGGSWSSGTSSTDKFGSDYRFKGQGNGSGFAQFTPIIPKTGTYEVHTWHPAGGNRTTAAPHVVTHGDGATRTILVNQQLNGGAWRLLGTFHFQAGTSGNVKIHDGFTGSGGVVMADAVRFVFVPPVNPPLITKQPEDQTIIQGSVATFTVQASGSAPLSYQWKRNGQNIAGATTPILQMSDVSVGQEGEYLVEVSNSAGKTASDVATLAVLQPPLIVTHPSSQTVNLGSGLNLFVVVSGSEPFQYQWLHDDTPIALQNGSSLEIEAVDSAAAGMYRVRVSNPAGEALSNAAEITIISAPEPPTISGLSLPVEGKIRLTITTVPGRNYVVEASEDLQSWSEAATFTASDRASTVDAGRSSQASFYRVQLK